jgi:hypothetical protein
MVLKYVNLSSRLLLIFLLSISVIPMALANSTYKNVFNKLIKSFDSYKILTDEYAGEYEGIYTMPLEAMESIWLIRRHEIQEYCLSSRFTMIVHFRILVGAWPRRMIAKGNKCEKLLLYTNESIPSNCKMMTKEKSVVYAICNH